MSKLIKSHTLNMAYSLLHVSETSIKQLKEKKSLIR